MKSFIAALRSLVLPFGATSGPRIVLDGVNGSIQVYDAANTLIGVLDSNGFIVTGSTEKITINALGQLLSQAIPDNGSFVEVTNAAGFGGILFLQPENSTVPGVTFDPGQIYADNVDTGGVSARPYVKVRSPFVNPALHTSQILFKGQASDSVADDSFHEMVAGKGPFWTDYNVDSGKGWCTGAGIAGVTAAIGAVETVAITIPSFTYKAGRAYRLQTSGTFAVTAAPQRPAFRIRKTNAAGTLIFQTAISAQTGGMMDLSFTCYFWCAADVTTALVLTQQGSAAFNVNLQGGNGVNIYDDTETASISSYAPQLT